ncbi:MAG: hypothetical protein J6T47_06280 [Lachnospiraceae bacterium]|nr:hypothetical protein [Lachnospiraceae bacterium]
MKKTDYTSGVTAADPKEIRLGLSRMRKLLEILGDPQKKLKIVHVAGTNGKGTVIAFLKSVLCQKKERKVGVFTTPAVFSPYEAIGINGRNITPKKLRELTEEVNAVCENRFPEENRPSPFERLTAKAFLYFARERTDIVLLETGLGGDLDATNAYDAGQQLSAVLTSVGMDHMDLLGDTPAQIAAHKAGILREERPVITGRNIPPEALDVIRAAAQKLHCPVIDSTRYARRIAKLRLAMAGRAAADNAACAYACLCELQSLGFSIDEEEIRRGLSETVLPGRFEILPLTKENERVVILDGAHNLPAAEAFAENIKSGWKDYKKIIVCGMLKDKDHAAVLRQIAGLSPNAVYFGATRGKRGLSAVELSQDLMREPEAKDCEVRRFGSVRQAFSAALDRSAQLQGKVLVAALGSFTFLETLKQEIRRRNDEKR